MNTYLENFLFLNLLLCWLCYGHVATAQEQISTASAAPQITCPEIKTINICAPVGSPAQLSFDNFNPTDDNTPTAEIEFEVQETLNILNDVTVMTHQYSFTDKDGNSSYCEMVYNITNRFMQAPVFPNQYRICQDDFFRGLKLGKANYMIYNDHNGQPGNLLGKCDQAGLLCAADNLNINAAEGGLSRLWLTEFISFPDASICESEATRLTIEVIEKPTAKLTTNLHQAEAGTVLNLMNFVEENTNGFWNGKGVFSATTVDGSLAWFFTATGVSTAKLYYTVSNLTCSQSYWLLIEPKANETCHLGEACTIQFDETKTIDSEGLTIHFSSISDSRCPAEAVCFWEGIATASVEISSSKESGTITLNTFGACAPLEPDLFNGPCEGEQKDTLGYRFTLVSIDPYPGGLPADENEYSISLIVEKSATAVSTTELSQAQNTFAINLFKEANAIDAEDENVIISPLSVAIALAMVSNGANGATLTEFQQVMHLNDYELANINAGYLDYMQKLQNLDEQLSLEIANAVFYDDGGIAVNPAFIETVQQYYDAQIEVKDFKDEATVEDINNWVKTNTANKIEKIIDQINPAEIMFLLNAIYFKANWSKPFNKALTLEGNFTLDDGNSETVEFMGNRDRWEIFTNANLNAVNIPLGDSIYNMLFIQPANENTSLKSFASNFSLSDFSEITTGLSNRDYIVSIPKFELSYENQMNDDLMNLGLTLPFNEAAADFSNLGTAGGNLYISRVVHKTYLKIDEDGATAAAVTGVGVGVTSVPPSIRFNRPFICLIWEKADNSILFMAKIMNPNAE